MVRVYFLSVSFIEKNHLMKYIMYFENGCCLCKSVSYILHDTAKLGNDNTLP